jgi:hypothetical protein
MRNIGSVLAVAMYGTIFTIVAFAGGMDPAAKHLAVSAMDAGFNAVFLFGAGLGAVLLLLSFVVREQERTDQPGDEQVCVTGEM